MSANAAPARKSLETLSFEQALSELETIVRSLETGEAPLDQSISAYERGVALKAHCEGKLREAQMKIEQISVSPEGQVTTKPMNEEF